MAVCHTTYKTFFLLIIGNPDFSIYFLLSAVRKNRTAG